jgi:hypothetical protein
MRGLIVTAVEIMLLTLCVRAGELPERIAFPSADGRTTLTGYLFMPPHSVSKQVPAVVMMHGRAGAYSTIAKGRYDATTLSRRHMAWGELWATQGYIALLVDGFGPRGYPQGFPRFSYERRPAELNEVTVRPLDAYGHSRICAHGPTWTLIALGCKVGPTAAAQHSPPWTPVPPVALGQDFVPLWPFIRPAG